MKAPAVPCLCQRQAVSDTQLRRPGIFDSLGCPFGAIGAEHDHLDTQRSKVIQCSFNLSHLADTDRAVKASILNHQRAVFALVGLQIEVTTANGFDFKGRNGISRYQHVFSS